MGFLSRFYEPYVNVYVLEEHVMYSHHFVDAYFFAKQDFSAKFNTRSKLLYAAFYSTLFRFMQNRPYHPGELYVQVVNTIGRVDKVANKMNIENRQPLMVLLGSSCGYATAIMMKVFNVSPGKACQMGMFDDCFDYVSTQKPFLTAFVPEYMESVKRKISGEIIIESGSTMGFNWADTMSMITEDHFLEDRNANQNKNITIV